MGISYTISTSKGKMNSYLNITFSSTPDKDTTESLKAIGFTYFAPTKTWGCKVADGLEAKAKAICDKSSERVKESKPKAEKGTAKEKTPTKTDITNNRLETLENRVNNLDSKLDSILELLKK